MSIIAGTILRHKDVEGNAFYLTVEETGFFNAANTNGFSARSDDGTLHVFYEGDDKHMEVVSVPNPNANANCDTCFGTGTASGRYGSSYKCSCVLVKEIVSSFATDGEAALDFVAWLNGEVA